MPVPTDLVTLVVSKKALLRNLNPASADSGRAAFTLAWTVAEAGVRYRIEYKQSADSTWSSGGLTAEQAAGANVPTNDTPLGAPIPYDFRVRGENGSGNSAWFTITAQDSGVPPAVDADLDAPDSLTFSAITDISALLTIGESEDDETAYQVDVYLADDNTYLFTLYAEELVTVLTLESLSPETNYRVDVHALGFPEAYVPGSPFIEGDITSGTFSTGVDTGAIGSGITGPATIVGRIFAAIAGDFTLDPAPADTATWSISGGPLGVTVTGTGTLNVTGRIGGEPSEAGLFDAVVSATWDDAGTIHIAFAGVRFLIDGGSFLSWLNDDPARLDLQQDVGTRVLTSTKANEQDGLWLKHGDDFDAWLIFRDRARVLAPVIDAVRLKLALKNNFAAPPLIEIRPDPLLVVFLGGYRVYRLQGQLSSPVLTTLFTALNAEPGESSDTADCELELSWRTEGRWVSSRPLKVTLAQDYLRQ